MEETFRLHISYTAAVWGRSVGVKMSVIPRHIKVCYVILSVSGCVSICVCAQNGVLLFVCPLTCYRSLVQAVVQRTRA